MHRRRTQSYKFVMQPPQWRRPRLEEIPDRCSMQCYVMLKSAYGLIDSAVARNMAVWRLICTILSAANIIFSVLSLRIRRTALQTRGILGVRSRRLKLSLCPLVSELLISIYASYPDKSPPAIHIRYITYHIS